jgi:hypothetical protein
MEIIKDFETFFSDSKMKVSDSYYFKEPLYILNIKPLLNKISYFNLSNNDI